MSQQGNMNNDSAISVASVHSFNKMEPGKQDQDQGAHPEAFSTSHTYSHQPGSASTAPSHGPQEHLTSLRQTASEGSQDNDQPQSSSRDGADEEEQSHITSPLTHPNGLSMFPNLSTEEQDQLSRDALQQAQDVIIAELEQPSDDLDSQSDGDRSDGDRSDGGYESLSEESSSTSLASSVRDFMFENGRRYHRFREGTYNFPNDEVEQEREDMKHAMMKLLCSQKLHFAPIGENPQRILDIGTGTGIWAIEVGDQYPSAEVLGVDLSPIQPSWIPPNVRFVVDDIESPWLYPRNHFDYIHSRHTVMAIKDWPRLLRRSLEHLKPGGWMEMQEIHHSPMSGGSTGVVPPDNPVAQYWSLINAGLAALGVNFHAAAGSQLSNMMREAGFVNVTERVLHVPLGTWPKNKVLKAVGLYWRTILVDGLQAIALGPLTRGLKWDRNRIELLLMNVRRAYFDDSALIYMRLHLVYGQKA